jgi:hypothetical protein
VASVMAVGFQNSVWTHYLFAASFSWTLGILVFYAVYNSNEGRPGA